MDLSDSNGRKKLKREGQSKELIVHLGAERDVECRLIIEKVPGQLADEKRRKLKTDKVNKRKAISKGRLDFCDLNVFITNATADQLPIESVRAIYGLRWQIEIYFKTWKSYMNIDKIENMNIHRFNCTHYGTLIYIILTGKIFFFFKHKSWQACRIELSELKAMKLLAKRKEMMWKVLFAPIKTACTVLDALADNLLTNCFKESKKNKITPYESISYALS